MVLKRGTGESFGKKVWKKIKLHGTQTQSRHHSRFGRRRKLQGSQTWTKSAQTPVQFGRAEEITGLSNSTFQPQAGLEGDRITGLSTIVNGQLYWVWKGIGLYGTQTAE